MMSAWRAMAWALSTASAPREVIIWVPLIRARPCRVDTRLEVHMCPPLSNHRDRQTAAFPLIPGSMVRLSQTWECCWVLNMTSFGFSDIGFSPWASRTWSEIKGRQIQSQSKDHQTANMSCGTLWPFQWPFLQAWRRKKKRKSRRDSASQSYIFCICPAALRGPHFALSHQPQGQVGERRQVSTRAHCPFLWDEGEAGSCRGKVR